MRTSSERPNNRCNRCILGALLYLDLHGVPAVANDSGFRLPTNTELATG